MVGEGLGVELRSGLRLVACRAESRVEVGGKVGAQVSGVWWVWV